MNRADLLPYTEEHLQSILRPGLKPVDGEIIDTYLSSAFAELPGIRERLEKLPREDCPGSYQDLDCFYGSTRKAITGAAGAVCEILHTNAAGTKSCVGTGILVKSSDLILTAGHVITNQSTPTSFSVRFEHSRTCNGSVNTGIEFDVDVLTAELKRSGLDYAILQARANGGQLPGSIVSPAMLGNPTTLKLKDPLFCIHHPHAQPRQLSQGPFLGALDPYLQYRIYTANGSSGGPLFNSQGELMAVHMAPYGGCPRIGPAIHKINEVSDCLP